jgi:hypothetical protein
VERSRRLWWSTISEPDRAGIANLLKAWFARIVIDRRTQIFASPLWKINCRNGRGAMLPVDAGAIALKTR